MAFRSAGAKDWKPNLQILFAHTETQHKLQFHHFFTRALLKKAGYTSRKADDIANLTFISGKINRSISVKPPATYVQEILATQGGQVLEMQCIPKNLEFAVTANKDFLSIRRTLLAARLNEFLGL